MANSESIDGDDDDNKIEKLKDRCEMGDGNAMFELGHLYFLDEKYSEALPYFQQAADKGSYQARYQLGVMHYDGLGVECDPAKGCDYMRQVIDNENRKIEHLIPSAQFNLGRAYLEGYGVAQSDDDALEWLERAAREGLPSGNVAAQSMLGMLYSRQDFLDVKKAFRWHQHAARNGSLESLGALGVMYEHGVGTRVDTKMALRCLKDASDRGSVYATASLVAHYFNRRLYTKAVQFALTVVTLDDKNIHMIAQRTTCDAIFVSRGIALACFYLGRCFHTGQGVDKSIPEAKKWYDKASKLDKEIAAQLHHQVTVGGQK
ncbi:LRP2-binding protein-like [Corticium candelabrum]|uniref:LRP2-binding protein-like n=1 Tax=Corticium candelabrum TaxID=121492 RepID=UPI002E260E7E|nr:LRP2-binding protein-like [Corticium candelabrum]